MRLKIQEPLARRALESVLEVAGQYGTWIATIGVDDQTPVRRYERLTALADYIEGLFGQSEIIADIEKRDANLLVSCTVFSMTILVESIPADASMEEFERVELAVRELYAVAIEFAIDTVRLIPRLDGKRPLPKDVRRIIDAINAIVNSGNALPMPALTKPDASPDVDRGIPIVTEEEHRRTQWSGGEAVARNPIAKRQTHYVPAAGPEVGGCVELSPDATAKGYVDREMDPQFDEPPMPSGDIYVATEGLADPEMDPQFGKPPMPSGGPYVAPQSDQPSMPSEGAHVSDADLFDDGFPINMACITERGLVRQIEADREMFDMALGADEYRIVSVMLCSLLEAVILQLSIPRRRELQLTGTPDAWDLHNLLIGFTQDPEIAQDRLTLERVLIGRHLLMPAEQLMRPHDPQRDEIAGMLESVGRFLAHVGFSTANLGPS